MALLVTKSRKTAYAGSPLSGHWLRGVDLNHRPLGYEPNELPDCSTPRIDDNNRLTKRQTPVALVLSMNRGLVLRPQVID
jgi:hypothetical protein